MVLGSAAAVQHHLRQQDLGLHHADIGGALHPAAPLLRIGVHATAFDQHAAVPVLGVHHAIGGAAQPLRRLPVVALHADPFGQADAEIERRHQVARGGRLLEPLARADRVLGSPPWPLQQQVGKVDPRRLVTRLGGDAEPVRRLLGVARHAGAGQVQHAEGTRAAAMAGFRRAAEPHRRLGVVRRQLAALGVEVADRRRRLRIARERRAAQPRFALDRVGRDA